MENDIEDAVEFGYDKMHGFCSLYAVIVIVRMIY